jgi:hypothetical protein
MNRSEDNTIPNIAAAFVGLSSGGYIDDEELAFRNFMKPRLNPARK